MLDVEPTAAAIEGAANRLEDAARELRRQASEMRNDHDITRMAEVMSSIQTAFANLRLDLLITRPLRALGQK